MKKNSLFAGVDEVQRDLECSRAKAYEVIRELNRDLKTKNPKAIVIAGRVNRAWYYEALMTNEKEV